MDTQSRNTPMLIALILAIVAAVGVIVGAKVVADRTPVTLSPIGDVPASCASVMEALPARIDGHARSPLTEPAPDGAAAYGSLLTIRCGVPRPEQLSVLSELEEHSGTEWLKLTEAPMTTWFTATRDPIIAITTEDGSTTGVDQLADAVAATAENPHAIPSAPLTDLPAGLPGRCDELSLAPTYGAFTMFDAGIAETVPPTTFYRDEAGAIMAIRCGVTLSDNYAAGAQLIQVNEVPWFQDGLVYYSMGETTVAIYNPTESALTDISTQLGPVAG